MFLWSRMVKMPRSEMKFIVSLLYLSKTDNSLTIKRLSVTKAHIRKKCTKLQRIRKYSLGQLVLLVRIQNQTRGFQGKQTSCTVHRQYQQYGGSIVDPTSSTHTLYLRFTFNPYYILHLELASVCIGVVQTVYAQV